MAAVITCSVSQTGSCNMGSPTNFVVAVANSDATTATDVESIQLVVSPAAEPANIGAVQFPTGRSIQVAASSTIYFSGNIVFNGPQLQGSGGTNSSAGQQCSVVAVVTCTDGSVCTSPRIGVVPNMAMASAALDGQLRYDNNTAASDSYTLPVVITGYVGVLSNVANS